MLGSVMWKRLGLRFELEPPGVVASFTPGPEHEGPPGHLHGGVAATALDETMASLSWLLDRTRCVTGTLEVKYRRGVPLGEPVRIEAWRVDPARGPRAHHRVRGRIVAADGRVAVEAKALFITVPDR